MYKIFVLFFVLMFFLIGCSNNSNNNNFNNSNSSNINSDNSTIYNSYSNYSTNNSSYNISKDEIATFSTNILNKDSSRQKNIDIACESLNGTIVKKGETFSFCDTLGPAKPEDGYEKADTFDQDGDIFQEYGGGKCQVSSTLYNAVLKVAELEVVERHPHSGDVDYVEKGKDAAVSYGSIDFKFKNNTNFDIKIGASTNSEVVTITLYKLYN